MVNLPDSDAAETCVVCDYPPAERCRECGAAVCQYMSCRVIHDTKHRGILPGYDPFIGR